MFVVDLHNPVSARQDDRQTTYDVTAAVALDRFPVQCRIQQGGGILQCEVGRRRAVT